MQKNSNDLKDRIVLHTFNFIQQNNKEDANKAKELLKEYALYYRVPIEAGKKMVLTLAFSYFIYSERPMVERVTNLYSAL